MIVFLDDEPMFVQAYVETMEDAGLAVELVTDTAEFLSRLSNDTAAVVIDLMLPEGPDAGFTAFERVRHQYPCLPAVLLTNRADVDLGLLDDHAVLVSKREILPDELLLILERIGGISTDAPGK